MNALSILVLGATGTVGGHIVEQLSHSGHHVRALVRDRSKALRFDPSVEVVVGDLSDPASLDGAFAGVESVFVVAPPSPDLPLLERNAIEAARRAAVWKIVYLSNFGAGTFEGALWQWHGESEKRIQDSRHKWTILRPARFMRDTPFPWSLDRSAGTFAEALGEGSVTVIDPRDIAEVATAALTTRDHAGQIYELTAAEAFTGETLAALFFGALAKPIRYIDLPPAEERALLQKIGLPEFIVEAVGQYHQSIRDGRWYVTGTAAEVLGRAPRTMQDWLSSRGALQAT